MRAYACAVCVCMCCVRMHVLCAYACVACVYLCCVRTRYLCCVRTRYLCCVRTYTCAACVLDTCAACVYACAVCVLEGSQSLVCERCENDMNMQVYVKCAYASPLCISRVGQNRISAPYMTVCMVNSLPKIPYIHRIYL